MSDLIPITNSEVVPVERLKREVVTLAGGIQIYLNRVRRDCKLRTFTSYRDALMDFVKTAGDHQIVTKDPREWMFKMAEIIDQWHRGMDARKLSAHTKSAWDSHVRSFFKFCERYEITTYNPYRIIRKRYKMPSVRYVLFTTEEYNKMLELAIGSVNFYLVVCGYWTGMTMVDCCTLTWDHVDLNKCLITRVRTKMEYAGNQATIPIIPNGDLYKMLKMLKDNPDKRYDYKNGPNFVYPRLAISYLRGYQNVSENFKRFVHVKCGFGKGKSFATFRRTFCSMLANSNTNISLAMQMTGHTNPKSFNHYVLPNLKALHDTFSDAVDSRKDLELAYDPSLEVDGSTELVEGRLPSTDPGENADLWSATSPTTGDPITKLPRTYNMTTQPTYGTGKIPKP